jgi:hypothetical protein
MGFANRAIVAAGLGFAVSALVGCGGSGSLLSSDQANRLSTQLEQASQDIASYHCKSADTDISNFRSSVDSLNSVNSTLIRNLDQGASTISDLASRDCPVSYQTTTTKQTTSTTRTATVKTDTDTTPTTTTATDTTTTQTTPTTTVITIPTTTDTTTTGTDTGTTTTGTDTTPSGGTGLGDTTTTSTVSTGFGDGAQGTG